MKILTILLMSISLLLLSSCVNGKLPDGFWDGLGLRVKTPKGDIYADKDGVSGEIVIDTQSGK